MSASAAVAVNVTAPLSLVISPAPTVRSPAASVMLTAPKPACVPLTVNPPASVFATCTALLVLLKVNVETTVSSALPLPIPLAAAADNVPATTSVAAFALPTMSLPAFSVTVAAPVLTPVTPAP